jgi:DNA-binding transcriptional regulator LsrR (DeoR family)
MEGLTTSKIEQKRNQIGRYYFAMKYTMQQISEAMGISHQSVSESIKEIKNINYNIIIMMYTYIFWPYS